MKRLVILLLLLFSISLVSAIDCVDKCLNKSYYGGYCGSECEEGESSLNYACDQQSLVSLAVSDSVEEVYDNSDPYIDENEDNPGWVWHIANVDTNARTEITDASAESSFAGPVIGVKNFFYSDSLEENSSLSSRVAMDLDDEICFPEERYICIKFSDITSVTYDTITIEKTIVDLSSFNSSWTSKAAIYVYASVADSFKTSSSIATDKFWIIGNDSGSHVSVYYEDASNAKVFLATYTMDDSSDDNNFGEMDYGGTTGSDVQFDLKGDFSSGNALDLILDISGEEGLVTTGRDDMTISLGHTSDGDFNAIGATASTAEADELVWDSTNLGTKDEDHLSLYGILISNPNTNGASDRVKFQIPSDQVRIGVTISGTGNKSNDLIFNRSYQPTGERSELSEVKLSSEVLNPRDYNLILIGGPCANPLVTAVFGLTCQDWDLGKGEGMIKMVENGDNYALLLAGTDEDDTERVYNLMLNRSDYDLSGKEFIVFQNRIEEKENKEGNISIDKYPWPFVKDFEYDNLLVVFGDDALAKDTIGAFEIMYELQNLTSGYTLVVSNSSDEDMDSGEIFDWIALGNNFSDSGFFSSIIQYPELNSLHDEEFGLGSDDIEYRDMLMFYQGGPRVHTSLTASEEDYGVTPYIEIETGDLRYYFGFDDKVNLSTVTLSNTLKFRFLGEWLEITAFDDGTKLSLQSGEEHELRVDESFVYNNKNVTLEGVDSGGLVELSVDGNVTILQELQRKEVQNIFIKNQWTLFHEGGECCCVNVAFY